jgi:hypothetical protein
VYNSAGASTPSAAQNGIQGGRGPAGVGGAAGVGTSAGSASLGTSGAGGNFGAAGATGVAPAVVTGGYAVLSAGGTAGKAIELSGAAVPTVAGSVLGLIS